MLNESTASKRMVIPSRRLPMATFTFSLVQIRLARRAQHSPDNSWCSSRVASWTVCCRARDHVSQGGPVNQPTMHPASNALQKKANASALAKFPTLIEHNIDGERFEAKFFHKSLQLISVSTYFLFCPTIHPLTHSLSEHLPSVFFQKRGWQTSEFYSWVCGEQYRKASSSPCVARQNSDAPKCGGKQSVSQWQTNSLRSKQDIDLLLQRNEASDSHYPRSPVGARCCTAEAPLIGSMVAKGCFPGFHQTLLLLLHPNSMQCASSERWQRSLCLKIRIPMRGALLLLCSTIDARANVFQRSLVEIILSAGRLPLHMIL